MAETVELIEVLEKQALAALPPNAQIGSLFASGWRLFQASTSPSLLINRTGVLMGANTAAGCLFDKPATLIADAMRRIHFLYVGRWTPIVITLAEHLSTGRRSFPLHSPSLGDCVITFDSVDGEQPNYRGDRLQPQVLLAVVSPPSTDDPSYLKMKYRFTEAEARVAGLLMHGHTPQHIAEVTNVRLSTVRTHVQHIYEKTGTRRQVELLSKLLERRNNSK